MRNLLILTIVLPLTGVMAQVATVAASDGKNPAVTVVQGGDPAEDYRHCRHMLVGPGVNQPDPYLGYGGFVGWHVTEFSQTFAGEPLVPAW